ncbi:hypothetical protein KP509_11G080700 [Ceratopteris richardii]|uniref:Uncharacterized protein n=1 Tax=Ceratopteris richardii TaxID=49495 RepID=A0A8T2TUR3_CERRI|nr:hypothetical protein KP509_11G080700 [Ceratopteris richardii]
MLRSEGPMLPLFFPLRSTVGSWMKTHLVFYNVRRRAFMVIFRCDVVC